MTKSQIVALMLAGASLISCHRATCVLPVADAGSQPSPASLVGIITAVNHNRLELRPDSAGEPQTGIVVRLDEATQSFTVYGGYVAKERLAIGQHASIWYRDCQIPPNPGGAVAAIIMLDSKAPSDALP